MADQIALAAKIRTNVGWATRYKAALDNEAAIFERAGGLMLSDMLTACMDKYNAKMAEIEAQLLELIEVVEDDAEKVKKYTDKSAEVATEWANTRTEYANALIRTENARIKKKVPPPAQPAPGQVQAPREAKEARGVRPEVLSAENTPAEFAAWLREYEAYHDLSNFRLLSPQQQRVYLNRLLSKDIVRALASVCGDGTPVLGANGCLSQLQNEFRSYYPLTARRHAAIGISPARGESDKDFWIRMWDQFQEADMASISMEQAFCVLYSTHCPNSELRKELRKLKVIGRKEYREVMEEITAESNTSSQTKDKDKPSKINQVKGGKSGSQPANKSGKPAAGSGPYDSSKTCESCGARGHDKAACRGTLQITCNKCGQIGHFQSFCKNDEKKKSAKAKKAS